MELYVANICVLEEKQIYDRLFQMLPKERREQVERYRNESDKWRGVGAGILLEYVLEKKGYTLLEDQNDKTYVRLTKGVHGKPYLEAVSNLYFNLSHSGDYVVVAFAENEVGVDMERNRVANLAVARRFFTKEEQEYLQEICNVYGNGEILAKAFARIWTRKESYIKAVGEGMHLPLTDFCVLFDEMPGKEAYYFKTYEWSNDYTLSVCTSNEINVNITEVDLGKAFDGAI